MLDIYHPDYITSGKNTVGLALTKGSWLFLLSKESIPLKSFRWRFGEKPSDT